MTASPFLLGLRTAIYRARDIAKAKAWYTEVLGYGPYFDDPFYVALQASSMDVR